MCLTVLSSKDRIREIMLFIKIVASSTIRVVLHQILKPKVSEYLFSFLFSHDILSS
jgi:hypothetical protein